MRQVFTFLLLIAVSPVIAQEDCDNIVTIPELAAQIQEVQVDTIIMLSEGTYKVQLSNGNIYNVIVGCTNSGYLEYNDSANTDDGSCATEVVVGCTNPAYDEYNDSANTDDGSCASLLGCTDAGYDEYNDEAVVDDGSCTSLLGCTDPDYDEYNAEAMTDDGSCATISGCTDPAYDEYEALANADDGSCVTLSGCSESDFASMDGYNYSIVTIGDQCWFAENLRTTRYADGSGIPEVTGNGAWAGLNSGARCNYNNNAALVSTYGRLYNWYAVEDSRGLCPSGWHVPTDEEWTGLKDNITSQGHDGTEGTALKSTLAWPDDGIGTDDFGFSALPGGERRITAAGGFSVNKNHRGYWWTSTSYIGGGGDSWCRILKGTTTSIHRNHRGRGNGLSLRCLRDTDYSEFQGCTDPAYIEYNAAANTNDGSCATILGCTNSAYLEYNAAANTNDGSCATLIVNGCTDPAYTEFDASANTDDGSCATLVVNGCTDSDYEEFDASANTDDGSCVTLAYCHSPTMDNYSYSVVEINGRCWFAENLRTTRYADGSEIPEVTDDNEWTQQNGLDARCNYDNNEGNVETFGRLYNYHAVGELKLCPSGWHVPTDPEWSQLLWYLRDNGYAGTQGTALKSTSGWTGGGNGTDNFGFTALPGGFRDAFSGEFNSIGTAVYQGTGWWWTQTPYFSNAWPRSMWSGPTVFRNQKNKMFGFSVRCIKDVE